MELSAKTFKATFSAISNRWQVDLGEISFDIECLKIEGHDTGNKRLAVTIHEVIAEDVELEWLRNILIIKSAKNLKIEKAIQELYNPDMPKGLAKTVTVK